MTAMSPYRCSIVDRMARARARKVSAGRLVWASNSSTRPSALSSPDPMRAKSRRMRSFISQAALLVKVKAKMCRNARGSSCTKQHAKYRLTSL